MKITRRQLRRLIKEEIEASLLEQDTRPPHRRQGGAKGDPSRSDSHPGGVEGGGRPERRQPGSGGDPGAGGQAGGHLAGPADGASIKITSSGWDGEWTVTPCLPLSAYAIHPKLLIHRLYSDQLDLPDHIERDFPTTVTDRTKYSIVPVHYDPFSMRDLRESNRSRGSLPLLLEFSSGSHDGHRPVNIIDLETGKQAKGRMYRDLDLSFIECPFTAVVPEED